MRTRHSSLAVAALVPAALLLAACASPAPTASDTEPSASAEPTPRVVLTYDGGLLVVDGTTLEVEVDLPLDGFNRVNAAGDGRHVLVSTSEGFRVLDAGTWTVDGTSETAEPELTDLVFEASEPGHVVRHGDRTVLFADGTGEITAYDTDALLESNSELPETTVTESEEAHHGVAIELEDGTMLSTLGTPEERTGARALDDHGHEIARSEECPAVHGEGTVEGEVAVFGCSDGALVYADGEFTKIDSPDEYGRMGNMYVSETSSIAVADYNADPDSEGYLLTQLALIDTETLELEVVDVPEGASYTWRDVARGPADDIVLLSSDGSLYLLDDETGEELASYPVVEPWESPVEWQDPHPALVVHGTVAYVTEPASDSIHAIDLESGEILATGELPGTPNEIAVATGE